MDETSKVRYYDMFCKCNNKSRGNNNVDANRCNDFADDAEIDVQRKEDAVKIITREKCNNREKEVKQEQEK